MHKEPKENMDKKIKEIAERIYEQNENINKKIANIKGN